MQTVLDATKKLHLRIHSSYSSYSPFVERKVRISPRSSLLSRDTSFSSTVSAQSNPTRPSRGVISTTTSDEPPNPTILELGRMKGGPLKNRLTTLKSKGGSKASFDEGEEEDGADSVDIKLRQAKLLKEARSLGVMKPELDLRSYPSLGGASFIANELVCKFSCNAVNHEERIAVLTSRVRPFCENAGVSYDSVLVEHASSLCAGKNIGEKAIVEAASISRCCISSLVKCQVALTVIQAAKQLGKPSSCLTELSKDSLIWASGASSIRTELEEAIRLLLIDGIVIRYCGSSARDLFNVDNPRHSMKLLDFVCRHITYESVVSDALDLCDAFVQLSRADASTLILQRAVIAGDVDRCLELLEEIYVEDEKLAREACGRAVAFCAETIRECSEATALGESPLVSDMKKEQSLIACKAAVSMLALLQAHRRDFFAESVFGYHEEIQSSSWGSLQKEFERILELQESHSMFLTLADLRSEAQSFLAAKKMLHPVVELSNKGSDDKLRTLFGLFGKARRGCSLLFGSDQMDMSRLWGGVVKEAACQLVWASDGDCCVDFLGASGILDEIGTDAAFWAVLSVALSLCFKASNESSGVGDKTTLSRMKYVMRASSLLQDYALVNCPSNMIPVSVSIATLTDIVSQILIRADEGTGEILDSFRVKLNKEARIRREPLGANEGGIISQTSEVRLSGQPALHQMWYVGDGLLLPPMEALSQCVIYCKELMGCIQVGTKATHSTPLSGTISLHSFLGTRGAHAIGLRMLCNSTALQLSSVPSSFLATGGSTAQQSCFAHQETIRCLAERSLGGSGNGITSGTIDSQLAVSFLLSLPIKLAFKVRSIGSCFPTSELDCKLNETFFS